MNKVLVFLLFTTVTHAFWPFSIGTTTTVKPRVIMNSTFDDFSNGTSSSRDSENSTISIPLKTTVRQMKDGKRWEKYVFQQRNMRTSSRSTTVIQTTTSFSNDNSAV
ncbi:hypothetical protein CAEBREN_30946 [Caenorhabditis brenneri]|uniref:Uncharacterized protein n=1 Tax=Caenorhabditis brenneri TaxID=135651 RepID=G0NG48_CAEBE|nr:hypothetical protein CAEBREN_30946 [Caenorhabditis brenneri]